MKNPLNSDLIILLLIISFYLFWGLHSIALPVLLTDEAWIASLSYRILKNFSPEECSSARIQILGKWVPIFSAPYQFAGLSYLLIPFILVGGLNVISIRFFSIFFGIWTLWLLFIFCKKILNRMAAIIIVFLLAIDWGFICGTKMGINCGSPMLIFLLGSLYYFYEWYEKGRKDNFCIGSFLAVMGLYIESWFLWYVVGMIILSVIFLKSIRIKFSKKEIRNCLFLGMLSFCIVGSPLIYHEIKSNFEIIRYGIAEFRHTTWGIDNLQYLRHLSIRIHQFIDLPSSFLMQTICQSGSKINKSIIEGLTWSYNSLFLICLIWHIRAVVFERRECFSIVRRVMLILFFAMFFQTPFTFSHLSNVHMILFLPIVKILLGMFLFELINLSRGFKFAVITILMLLLVVHSYGLTNYYSILERNGGTGVNSDAIYRVADYLVSKEKRGIVIMDSQLSHLIFVITGGKIHEKYFDFIDWAGQEPVLIKLRRMGKGLWDKGNEEYYNFLETVGVKSFRVKFNQRVGEEIDNIDNVFLFRSQEFGLVKCADLFLELAQRKNKQVREIQRFYQRDGRLAYLLYEVY